MEAKYFNLLDEEVLDFIKKTEEFYPPDSTNASINDQRHFYDELCKHFAGEFPAGVEKNDRWVTTREGDILIREYSPNTKNEQAQILYMHGGGFVLGGLESHDHICAEFSSRTGLVVTAVEYRLCPEFLHPAAFQDCVNVYRRLAKESSKPIILAGDSAGGALAAAVARAVEDNNLTLIGQLLIYPALGRDERSRSMIEHKNAPLLSSADMTFYEQQRADGRDLSLDATANPLADDRFDELPPTVIFTADCDPLADDGALYEQALSTAGVPVKLIIEEGLVHGFLRARPSCRRASESFDRMVEALNMLAQKEWFFDHAN